MIRNRSNVYALTPVQILERHHILSQDFLEEFQVTKQFHNVDTGVPLRPED